jgi:hypothetical protein
MILVAAQTAEGVEHSIILQNAETVKLVGPSSHRYPPASLATISDDTARGVDAERVSDANARIATELPRAMPADQEVPVGDSGNGPVEKGCNLGGSGSEGQMGDYLGRWRAIAVTEMRRGMEVYVRRSLGGRHLGTAIEETLWEL